MKLFCCVVFCVAVFSIFSCKIIYLQIYVFSLIPHPPPPPLPSWCCPYLAISINRFRIQSCLAKNLFQKIKNPILRANQAQKQAYCVILMCFDFSVLSTSTQFFFWVHSRHQLLQILRKFWITLAFIEIKSKVFQVFWVYTKISLRILTVDFLDNKRLTTTNTCLGKYLSLVLSTTVFTKAQKFDLDWIFFSVVDKKLWQSSTSAKSVGEVNQRSTTTDTNIVKWKIK